MNFETIKLNDTAVVDSYILNPEISYNVEKKRPAIIICPGGGIFTSCN